MKPLSLLLALVVAIQPVLAQQQSPAVETLGQEQSSPTAAVPTAVPFEPITEQYPNGSYYEVEYRKLRRGTDMRFEYQLFEWQSTGICINLADVPAEGRAPVRLELDPVLGLTFSLPTYPNPKRAKSDLKPSPDGCTSEIRLKLKIHADENTPLGPTHISGRLKWQPFNLNGPQEVRERAFDIPIEIVEKNEKVTRTDHFTQPSPAWWLFAPVAVVGALYCAVAEGVGVGCPWIQ